MKQHYIRFILFFVALPLFSLAQNAPAQRDANCPGVPGACGYPAANSNQSVQRNGGPQAPLNGNGSLGVIYDQQKCGLDYASASQRLGKRFTPVGVNQPAPFAIAGIPACAVIEKAYLWAEGSGNGAAQTATITGPLGTSNFPMAIVGQGPDKCWGYSGSYTYRADVTSAIGGNGTYNISGLLTNPPTSGNDMDGATLIVIWSDASANWAGRIAIADGAVVVNGGTANVNMPLNPAVCAAPTNGRAFMATGDLQMAITSCTANGTAVPVAWNWWNFDQVNTNYTAGQANCNFNLNTGGDCFNLCVVGSYYRTTTCLTCPTASPLTVTPSSTPATCANCNGTASVSVSPAGSYTYSWAPSGGNSATATGLCPGTYTCTITGSCVTQTQTFTITTSGGSLTMGGTVTNADCAGQCNGSVVSTVTGGTAPYTFSWSPAATNTTTGATNTGTGLCAGTYTITVTDASGCTGTRTVTITQPPAITLVPSQTNILCNGQCTGSATVTASGGTGVYTYSWAPSGGTGSSATGLCVGTYTCTVTSGPAGCTATQIFNITQVPAITATQSQVNVACDGQCNGSASVVASGGTGVYTYAWAPSGGTGATASGLCAGTYTCTITSGPAGCTITRTFNITAPPPIVLTPAQTNVTCNGLCNGSATVTATGGPGPYTYAWAPSGGTGSTATGLCAGVYTVTVTSNPGGCTATQVFTITQPPALTTTGTQTNILCNGSCTGAASVTPSGGPGSYTYAWAPSGGTNATATGLCAGVYTVTVTSNPGGCTTTQTFNITQPPVLNATTSFTPATCGNNNGAASISVTGGVGPYSYAWTPSGSGPNPTGLAAGPYVVVVTDANGCTISRTITITNAGSPTATITASTNILCFNGNNGSATVSASGGTGPYSYDWTPGNPTGDGTPTATGLTAGTWTCTVTDANGCIATATVTLTQPPAFTSTAVATPVLCNGGATGTASVSTTGGSGGNTYDWTPGNPPGDGTNAVTGLTAGTWSVVVTDANGCSTTATVSVTQPAAITTTMASTPVLCNGGSTGTASVTATGGTGAYTYAWAPSGGNAASATNLAMGTYTVTVTDANGCTVQSTVAVTQPAAVTATTSFTQATCGNSNGSASVTASGGTGAYTYAWSPTGGTNATATGLPAGPYTVLVTDANGCTFTASVTIPNAGSPTVTITSTVNVSCFGGNNGSAVSSASGGTMPYTYAWTPTGGSAATGTNMVANAYTVTVTDANGCSAIATVTITQPPALTVTATSSPVLCNGGSTGSATVTASGGTGAYTYAWNPSGGTGTTATGLSAQTYTVTVTDANGCTAQATTTVTQPSAITATTTSTPVLCFGGNTGAASVTASGGTGAYTYAWSPSGGNAATASNLAAGPYTCIITDANGCTYTASVTVTQPTALTATTSFTQATCGNSNGAASVTASGGTGAYTYAWNPSGGNTATANNLPAGPYTCIITDANGCTFTASVTVPNASSPTASIVATTNVSCFGGNNGSATVSAAGGTFPYTYAWSPTGGTGLTGVNLIAGPYTVTVTDANGCTVQATVTITQPPVLTATAASSPVLCFGGATGSATCTPTGGAGSYTYAWAPSGGNAAIAPNLTAQTYTCTVTDQNGCTTTTTVTVTEPPLLTVTASSSPVLCFGGNTGSTSSTPSGGTGAYTYNWTPSGGTGQNASNLSAGPYTVIVTDANGCTASASTTVTEPTALTATTSFTQSTCGNSNGSASVTASGGTSGYTYLWSPSGGTNATATNLLAQAYSCLITDANGCTFTASVTVPNAGSPSVSIIASDSVSCFGGSDGYAACATTGGTTPYTYLWSNNDNDTLAGNLAAGSYTVVVTDANGCTDSASIVIDEPQLLTASTTSTDVLCNGGSTGTATATAQGGTGSYAYSWAPSGGNAATEPNLAADTYTVTVTDINGCTATATATVSEPDALAMNLSYTPVSCNAGSDGTVAASVTGGFGQYAYNWQPGNLPTQSGSNLPEGTYTCTVTDDNGCTTVVTVTVTEPPSIVITTASTSANCNQPDGGVSANATGGTGTLIYQWTNGPSTFDWNNIVSGTYSVIVTDSNGCTETATQVVQNLNGVTATLNTSTNLTCFSSGDGSISIGATGGVGPYTYAWTPNTTATTNTASGLSAGQYTVTVTDASGCTSAVNVLLTEPSMLTVQATANPSSVCQGSSVQLLSNAGGGTPSYQYGWLPGPMAGPTQTVTPQITTTYTAVVTDANGCTASSPVTVTINPMPSPQFQADVTQGCAPVCVNFSDLTTLASGTIISWSWDFGDNTTSSLQNPPLHCYATPGVYTVSLTVTTSAGCTQSIVLTNYISVFANPVASFTASPQPTTILNPMIQFTDASTNVASWLWSFGDLLGSSSVAQNPSFMYNQPDCYLVQLDVTSPDGCTAVDTMTVCIAEDVSIYVPNAFTPDGNGRNDIFNAVTTGIDPNKFELWIFDRWGNMIFYTNDMNKGWDGRVQGSSDVCQIDTYVWKIHCVGLNGKTFDLHGIVNLIM